LNGNSHNKYQGKSCRIHFQDTADKSSVRQKSDVNLLQSKYICVVLARNREKGEELGRAGC
jgi:hypothetical protein